ncbi:MAG: segregation/condensation protein A [Planctomycetaceae bacterium]|jgi:segregation and condensation protein A|nr:segregation/condensation protein A [Planctomycetaceae bacterium]
MFTAKLSIYQGPIDLLLYLVRKDELDIRDIPITLILEQYLDYIAILEEIDVNMAGEFLAIASMLIEIKSFEVLPGEESVEEEIDDPRKELVEQLLEYKKFCDAANTLQVRSERWQLRFPRLANDLPPRPRNMAEEPIREVELWDIVSAFGRILRENSPKAKHEIIYDETPISTHMKRIYQRLKVEERIAFRQLFVPGQHKTSMVGVFLASLELVRHEYANVFQDGNFGEIELACRQGTKSLDFAALDTVI